LFLYYMFIVSLGYVYCSFRICLLFLYYMFIVSLGYVYCSFIICLLFLYYMFIVSLGYVYCSFRICLLFLLYGMFIVLLWYMIFALGHMISCSFWAYIIVSVEHLFIVPLENTLNVHEHMFIVPLRHVLDLISTFLLLFYIYIYRSCATYVSCFFRTHVYCSFDTFTVHIGHMNIVPFIVPLVSNI
jgi:hypothetical protein